MRVFMLGWEFPPFISGGLGTACYGLTKAMSGLGTDIVFVLPRPVSTPFSTHVRLVSPHAGSPLASPDTEMRLDEFENVTFRAIDAQLANPYQTASQYEAPIKPRRNADVKGSESGAAAAAPPSPTASVSGTAADTATPGFIGARQDGTAHYAGDMFSEIQRYAALA